MDPATLFEELARHRADAGAAERNTKGNLTVGGSVRAMTSKGRIVVKLTPARTAQLVSEGVGTHYKGQRNAWLELHGELPADDVARVIDEALSG
ncbi:hypothetical protein LRS13_15830 [Svornostia abyssi]|uniref:Uncharacterized protein n=1 Tax=Svornostia abyssi TaxID=2898438 RepID=A0ABY5PBY4_9ACTN|nr:hypothetical protein LRS13_15830 [Parviterribacteraceae bacterium J379]